MVSYLHKFISFDYKIHHSREKLGQSGRCAMDLQFLYWVPRIIILNNPFHESNISRALPHSYPSPWPQEPCGTGCQDRGGSGSHCSKWQELGMWHQVFKVPDPPSTNLDHLAMIRVCQARASITGKGTGQLPPNSPASLFAPTTPLPHCIWPASCLLLSGHTQLHGLARASPAACDLFGSSRLLVPGSAIVFHEAGGQSHLLLEASFGMNPFS